MCFSFAGLGDMAVSNTIGSNVFDILVGLGVPWGLQTMAIDYGSTVCILNIFLMFSFSLFEANKQNKQKNHRHILKRKHANKN